jgi:5-formyltetrahydrofolate cyclo-ligase
MRTETGKKAEKSRLRKELRAKRKQLGESERISLDTSINCYLEEFFAKHQPSTIAAFWPFDGEPNLLPTLMATRQQGTRVVLPVIKPGESRPSLIFRQWSDTTEMEKSFFGIPEPCEGRVIPLPSIELLLMPLVGWTESGCRLGMGAGFYDRALQPLNRSDVPIRAGVAYQLQQVHDIPDEPWDIRLHMLLSEAGWHRCRPL